MSVFRIHSRWSHSGGTERTDIDTGQDQQTSQHQSDPDRLAVKPGRELDCPGAANVARKPPPDSVTPTGLRDGAGAAGRIDSPHGLGTSDHCKNPGNGYRTSQPQYWCPVELSSRHRPVLLRKRSFAWRARGFDNQPGESRSVTVTANPRLGVAVPRCSQH
jgi:hypothetical protein